MQTDNLISMNQFILKQDLEAFSQALFKQNIALQIENEKLKVKLEHLEQLLKAVDVPIVETRVFQSHNPMVTSEQINFTKR